MKKNLIYTTALSILFSGVFTSCRDDDNTVDNVDYNAQIEAKALSAEWNNYLEAATSELLDDCTELYDAWSKSDPSNAENTDFGNKIKTAGTSGNQAYTSQIDAIRTILDAGCATIAIEVGTQKIGGPNGLAGSGKRDQAVLEVESWYSWNSITDYSDNIISIRNTYFGNRIKDDWTTISANSISKFVASKNADLDTKVIDAIQKAHDAISSMPAPFRNNLTGSKVNEAISACAELEETIREIFPLLDQAGSYDFTATLATYVDDVVLPTYLELKNKATTLNNAAIKYNADPTQANLNAACEAWRAARVPWEQSEAILFGPAEALGLDPSMDSWPLDQAGIAPLLNDSKLKTVQNFINAIGSEEVRGFHTIELLLFKDGQNRKVN